MLRALLLYALLALAAVPAPAQDAPALPRFDVWEYRVEGNSSLPATDIERAVYPHLGPGRTIEDVEQARAALEEAYREAGYGTVLVDIPEQDVLEGVVRLAVTEGRVERLKVSGSRYFSLGRIKAAVPSLAPGEVPLLPEVQKELVALNKASADRAITPILRPGRTPGTLEVELQVEDQLPLHGSVELNNQYARDTSELRLNASLRYDNLWQREHSLGVSYQVSPQAPKEVQVFSGTYLFRLPEREDLIVLYGVHSNTDIATLGTLGVVGSGNIVGLRAIHPLRGTDTLYQSLTFGFDWKDFGETIGLLGSDDINNPIDYNRFSLAWNATFQGAEARTQLGAEVAFGIRGLGNTEREFQNKRFGAEPNYALLIANAERLQPLPLDLSLFVRARGQVAANPLISNEQFVAGGVNSVRGYLESQQLADDGIYGTVELRGPTWNAQTWSVLREFYLFAYFDGARLRVQDPLGGQSGDASLASAGLGLRLRTMSGLLADWDLAYPMEKSDPVRVGEIRTNFNVGYEF